MNDIQKRFLLFIFGCMLVRTVFVIVAKNYTQFLPMMGIAALLPAIGFFVIWSMDIRKTGAEVMGGPIWWNDLRPVHGLLYVIFVGMAIQKNPMAWIVLLLDMLIGLSGFLYFHYSQNNFSKLI